MKPILPLILLLAMFASPAGADPRLILPDFTSLEDNASEVVSITLDSPMIRLAGSFLDAGKPEDAAARELIRGLTGVYVKSYSFDDDFSYPRADIERVREQLSTRGWQRLVEVRSKKQQTKVDVYMWVERGIAGGLAVIASEPREFTIVNIVGSIDLEKLHQLEGKLGVPKLELEAKGPPAAN